MPDLFVSKEVPTQPKSETTNESLKLTNEPKVKASSDEQHPPREQKENIFSSLIKFPKKICFENQEPNEQIHLFLRRHFITNIGWILPTIFFSLLPFVIWVFLSLSGISTTDVPLSYLLILTIFYYLIVFGYAFLNFIIWFYNVGIVTQLRVIDIDVHNITSKNVASTNISDIVDVEYSQQGLLASTINYGDVNLQTEGLKPNFEFHRIPQPALVADIINDLRRAKPSNG
ncbi:MAG: hypothetical protein KatS3mg089_0012 [Patescibacteria group bacterium]|nr:MAG: hypothetical protein KatS3mg089_0012 [Patescibacteria group bacterium]